MVRPSVLCSLYRFLPCIFRSPLSRHSARHCRHSTLVLRHWVTDTTELDRAGAWQKSYLACERFLCVSVLALNPWIKFCQIPTQIYVCIYNFLDACACIHVPCLAHPSAPTKMCSVVEQRCCTVWFCWRAFLYSSSVLSKSLLSWWT